MKKFNFLTLLLAFAFASQAQIVINEFQPEADLVELKNTGSMGINVSTYELCSFPDYASIQSLTLVSGNLMMMPGDIIVVSGHFAGVSNLNDNELGLYVDGSYTNPDSMQDYVEWGSSGHQRSIIAETAGIWFSLDFIPSPTAGTSASWDGVSDDVSSWSWGETTFGAENGGTEVEGGTISTMDNTFLCASSGDEWTITADLVDASGTNSTFILTDGDSNVLITQTENTIDSNLLEDGTNLIWHLSYEDDVELAGLSNLADLVGTYSLSNSIEVTNGFTVGGTISTEEATSFCTSDGSQDIVAITTLGIIGSNFMYLITDMDSNIISTSSSDVVDFEGTPGGTSLIWHISYEDNVDINVANLDDLTGCFDLSNSIEVTAISPEGGMISTMDNTELCSDDSQDDIVNVSIANATGTNSTFVLTDTSNEIISMQTESEFNFEGFEEGECLIWNLSYEDASTLEATNLNDLSGCYGLSNSILITKNVGDACDCLGDGGLVATSDGGTEVLIFLSVDGELTFTTNTISEADYTYVITDENDVIIATTDATFDFTDSGVGVSHVYGVSHTGVLTAEVGQDISTVTAEGCSDVSSNFIIVNKELIDGVSESTVLSILTFPTEVENNLNISGINSDFTLILYSSAGQLVLNNAFNSNTKIVDLGNLTAGMYIGQIVTEGTRHNFRVIKK